MGPLKTHVLYLLIFIGGLSMFIVLMACLLSIPRSATG